MHREMLDVVISAFLLGRENELIYLVKAIGFVFLIYIVSNNLFFRREGLLISGATRNYVRGIGGARVLFKG